MDCKHISVTNDDGFTTCDDCGLKLDEKYVDKEQRFYGYSNTGDVTRHHRNKDTERSLYQDLEPLGFPQFIIEKANEYYIKIINDRIYRAKNRKSIVFACTFNAYIDIGEPQAANELAKKFVLDRKGISNGLKTFSTVFRNKPGKRYIEPMDLVPKIISDIGISDQCKHNEEIKQLYKDIIEKNLHIKTSIPQSVAAGLVFYYLKVNNYPINKLDFAKIVHLTEITFTKIALGISETTGKPIKF